MTSQHTLNVYQKPRRGRNFIKRYSIYNYRHTISANGWFDTASCNIRAKSFGDAEDFYANYIGSFIAVYVDNPAEPIFEGLISRITLSAGSTTYTISLDEMYNSVIVNYSTSVSANPVQTAAVQNLTSRELYGFKQGSVEFGFAWGGAGDQFTALGEKILAAQSFPQSSIEASPGAGFSLNVEIIGIYQTLKWQLYYSASGSSQTYSAFVLARLAALSNTTTFFDNGDTSLVTTNAELRAIGDSPGKTVWDTLDTNAQAGDGSGVPWVVGISPTDFTLGTRRLYYRPANEVIEYTARIHDGLRVRSIYGKLIPPWLVRPDRVCLVTDALVGYSITSGDDPRQFYINTVEYDAETQQARLYGYDDITDEAAVGARNNSPVIYGKPLKVSRWRVS